MDKKTGTITLSISPNLIDAVMKGRLCRHCGSANVGHGSVMEWMDRIAVKVLVFECMDCGELTANVLEDV